MAAARGKRRLMGEINVVPYIDVMLVLLIIFMITAPLLTQGFQVELPKAGAEPIDSEGPEPLVLTVDREGLLYLNVGGEEETPIDASIVIARSAAVLRRTPDTPVLVRADTAVEYGKVVSAMVLLQRAGAEQVGFITDPAETSQYPEVEE